MNLNEFIKKYKIILFLFFLILISIIFRIKYKNLDKEVDQKIEVTPTLKMDIPEDYKEEMIDGNSDE